MFNAIWNYLKRYRYFRKFRSVISLDGDPYRDWGFLTEEGWVYFENYEALGEMDGKVR